MEHDDRTSKRVAWSELLLPPWQEALIHSTLPWTVDTERRTLFAKFAPHGSSFNPILFEPEECKLPHAGLLPRPWFDHLTGRSF